MTDEEIRDAEEQHIHRLCGFCKRNIKDTRIAEIQKNKKAVMNFYLPKSAPKELLLWFDDQIKEIEEGRV